MFVGVGSDVWALPAWVSYEKVDVWRVIPPSPPEKVAASEGSILNWDEIISAVVCLLLHGLDAPRSPEVLPLSRELKVKLFVPPLTSFNPSKDATPETWSHSCLLFTPIAETPA